jgi:hypothetical protein
LAQRFDFVDFFSNVQSMNNATVAEMAFRGKRWSVVFPFTQKRLSGHQQRRLACSGRVVIRV